MSKKHRTSKKQARLNQKVTIGDMRKYTMMCKFVASGKTCPFGQGCFYAHSPEQLVSLEADWGHVYRTQACESWTLNQSCPYGDKCSFLHDPKTSITRAEPEEVPIKPVHINVHNQTTPFTISMKDRPRTSHYAKPMSEALLRELESEPEDDLPISFENSPPSAWSETRPDRLLHFAWQHCALEQSSFNFSINPVALFARLDVV